MDKAPFLLNEWHPLKNRGLNSEVISLGSNRKIWWKCSKCSHEWQSTVYNRKNGSGCPKCAGRLGTLLKDGYPNLAIEWDHEKNSELGYKLDVATYGSAKKVWWICSKCGYNWNDRISHRTREGRGCSNCRKGTTLDKKLNSLHKD